MPPKENTNNDSNSWDISEPQAPSVATTPVSSPGSDQDAPAQDNTPPVSDAPAGQSAPLSVDERIRSNSTSSFSRPQDGLYGSSAAPLAGPSAKTPFWKNKKVMIPLSIAGVLLLIGGAGTAYALYNQPDRVLNDAFKRTISAESVAAKGVITYKDDQGNATVKLAVDSRAVGFSRLDFDASSETKGDAELDVEAEKMSLKGSFITDQKDYFVKLDDIKPTVDSVAKSVGMSDQDKQDIFAKLIEMINGKWVSITRTEVYDLLETSKEDRERQEKEFTCTQQAYQDFIAKDELQKPIFTLYEKNPFVVIGKQLDSEAINGRNSHHYELAYDVAKGKVFVDGFVETEIFTRIDGCFESDLKKQFKEDAKNEAEADEKDDTEPKVELWIDKWHHEPTRLRITQKEDTTETGYDTTITLNKAADVQKPAAQTTLKQLTDEIKRIFEDLFGVALASNRQKSEDLERQTDIKSIASQLEAAYAMNGYYPTLSEINSASWRQANRLYLDVEALKDPDGTEAALSSASSAGVYMYRPLTKSGAYCQVTNQCAAYKLTAKLGDGTSYTKESN